MSDTNGKQPENNVHMQAVMGFKIQGAPGVGAGSIDFNQIPEWLQIGLKEDNVASVIVGYENENATIYRLIPND